MALLQRFRKDQAGYLSMLMLVLFVGILLLTGIAIDLLKHEAERADLQAALDRGVLAAAALEQSEDIEAVVESYVRSSLSFGDDVTITVQPATSQTDRTIRATASYQSPAIFLSMIGMNELTVPARATAAEGKTEIEISLILDISGSMSWNLRIDRLRFAATTFLNVIEDA